MSQKLLTVPKHQKLSPDTSAVRAFPIKAASLTKDIKSSNRSVSRKSQEGLHPSSTHAVKVVNKVPHQTRYLPTTDNVAKKVGKVDGRRGILVCYMYYNDNITEGKPSYEQSCKFVYS